MSDDLLGLLKIDDDDQEEEEEEEYPVAPPRIAVLKVDVSTDGVALGSVGDVVVMAEDVFLAADLRARQCVHVLKIHNREYLKRDLAPQCSNFVMQ